MSALRFGTELQSHNHLAQRSEAFTSAMVCPSLSDWGGGVLISATACYCLPHPPP